MAIDGAFWQGVAKSWSKGLNLASRALLDDVAMSAVSEANDELRAHQTKEKIPNAFDAVFSALDDDDKCL